MPASAKEAITFLPNELLDKTVDFHSARLFAKTSCYWRSRFYQRQLNYAVSIQADEEQERILTNLIINFSLRLSEFSLQSWLDFLNDYYLNQNHVIKNRLLARGLMLMLDLSRTQRQLIEFKFLLQVYCQERNNPILFKFFYAMVETQNNEISLALDDQDLEDLCHGKYYLRNLYEAQLILAPITASHAILWGKFSKFNYKQKEINLRNYFLLLHAFFKRIPTAMATELAESHCKFAFNEYAGTQTCSAILDFLLFLYKNDTTKDFLRFLLNNPATYDKHVSRRHIFIRLHELVKLQDMTHDDQRVDWLLALLDNEVGKIDPEAMFPFVQQLCVQLGSQSRQRLILALLSRPDLKNAYLEKLLNIFFPISVSPKHKEFKDNEAMVAWLDGLLTMEGCDCFVPMIVSLPFIEKNFTTLTQAKQIQCWDWIKSNLNFNTDLAMMTALPNLMSQLPEECISQVDLAAPADRSKNLHM